MLSYNTGTIEGCMEYIALKHEANDLSGSTFLTYAIPPSLNDCHSNAHGTYEVGVALTSITQASWAEPDRPWREVGLQAYLEFVLRIM